MPLPFHLQKLPPEALDVLRFMGQNGGSFDTERLEQSGLSIRLIGKSIRRLINAGYIWLNGNGEYELTTEGKVSAREVIEHDAGASSDETLHNRPGQIYQRRLTVVLPRAVVNGQTIDLFLGVNPPAPENPVLPGTVHVDLKVSAVGGTVDNSLLTLEIPPDRAATPARLSLTPTQSVRPVRVRIDIIQSFDAATMEPLGGTYFDIPISTQPSPADSTTRAVGMDLMLKPPR